MKPLLPAALLLLLLSACGNNAEVKSVQKNDDGTTTTTTYDADNLTKLAKHSDAMTEKAEALKKLPPLSLEQLKALLPEELAGMKRTEYNTSSTMGYGMANADYRKDENTEVKLMVYDCAGEAGSAMYGMAYWGALNFQQENEREYTKTIDFNGGRAIEKYNKDDKSATLTYVANDRMLVTFESRNLSTDELKEVAKRLDLKP